MTDPILRLATRGSPLALAQARLVRTALATAHDWELDEIEDLCPIIIVRTSGDRIQDRRGSGKAEPDGGEEEPIDEQE